MIHVSSTSGNDTNPGTDIQRPNLILTRGNQTGLFRWGSGPVNHLAISGMHFQSTRLPDEGGVGVRFLGERRDLLIEDCLIEGFNITIVIQGGQRIEGVDRVLSDIKIRRNIIVDAHGSYDQGTNGKSQGMYIGDRMFDGLLIEKISSIETAGFSGLHRPITH